MYCSREQRDVPESELRKDDDWGWVHDVPPPHTTKGTVLRPPKIPRVQTPEGISDPDGL